MGEIIKGVAEVIQSFLTINLLDSQNVISTLDFDEISRKRRLSVKLRGSFWTMHCCLSALFKLRDDNDFVMNAGLKEIKDCNGDGDPELELTANFFEQ